MTANLLRRLEALERARVDASPVLVVEGEPTEEQRRAIDAAERAGKPLRVIRLVFG